VLAAGPVTTLVLAEPLVATALGVGVLDERLPALGVAGAALVLAGPGAAGRRVEPAPPSAAVAAAARPPT
jgi:DME family drug/metabolite transporter